MQEPDRTKITDMQWNEVKKYFNDTLNEYKNLIGMPGVNSTFAITNVFDPLLKRYNQGERSQQLYNAMFAVE